jgi:type III secretion protein T
MIVLASPVIATMLMSELALGLLSRFSPQLNAFSVSLTLKSLIAVAVMVIYFSPIFPDELHRIKWYTQQLPSWISEK